MKPRHGFAPQPGDPPVELVMDQYQMSADQYLRWIQFMLNGEVYRFTIKPIRLLIQGHIEE